MASSKDRGLGKGLGALLGDNALQPQEGGSLSLPITHPSPSPGFHVYRIPLRHFPEGKNMHRSQ